MPASRPTSGELNRTIDGGETATTITASSVPLASAAFALADARGRGRHGRQDRRLRRRRCELRRDRRRHRRQRSSRLRRGPDPDVGVRAGREGPDRVHRSTVARRGRSRRSRHRRTSSTRRGPTSRPATRSTRRGGLFRTRQRRRELVDADARARAAPRNAVLALPAGGPVLLVGPAGVKRVDRRRRSSTASAGKLGQQRPRSATRSSRARRSSPGRRGGKEPAREREQGRDAGRRSSCPSKKTRIRNVVVHEPGSAATCSIAQGRVWSTRNGGQQLEGVDRRPGPGAGVEPRVRLGANGYLNVGRFGGGTDGYVLHTSDGGATWRPQAIATGRVAATASSPPTPRTRSRSSADRRRRSGSFFFTASGGDAGAASSLTIKDVAGELHEDVAASKARGKVTISGRLGGRASAASG